MANWNLKLDPDDPASYSGGKPAGRGVITASEYVIFAFPVKEGSDAKPIYKTMARWEIAFENQTKLWNEHLYVAYAPGDKVGAGLVPSIDGETPAGGTVADIIDLREGRRHFDPVPFRGPDVIPVKGGTFADDSELRFALRAVKAASAENAADNQAKVDGVTDRLVLADELNHTDISWMVGLDVEFDRILMEASTKPRKKSNLLGGAADEAKKPYQPNVPCPTHLYGKKTAEEVAAIRAQYLANAESQAGSPQGPMAGAAGMGSSAPSPASTSVMPPGAGASTATTKKAAKKLAIEPEVKERIDGHILAYLATPKKIGDKEFDDRGLITQMMSHVVQKDLKGSGVDLRVASNYIQTLETGDWWEIGAGGLVVLTEDGKSEAVVRAALAAG